MSFKITNLDDTKIFATILDYQEMPEPIKPSKLVYYKRKRWGSLVWNRQNILISRGEVFSEREFETSKGLSRRISANATISSRLLN